jgi:hypothetical protein
MHRLSSDELPEQLDPARRVLLLDLDAFWLRLNDLRFGQMLRPAVERPGVRPNDLTDEAVTAGLASALETIREVPVPSGPYWDTEATRGGNFRRGRPRDPARIPRLLQAFARAWSVHPELSLGQLFDYALDQAGILENEFGTRWLVIEDGPLRRALEAVADQSPGTSR